MRLERIPMEVLVLLVERAGTLVVATAFMRPYGARTYSSIATPRSIPRCGRYERRSATMRIGRRFVETVVGKGYRFVGPIIRETADAERQVANYRLTRGTHAFALQDGENLIGRDPDVHVFLDHPSVSRRHARISITADRVVLEDLNSRNGTCVDGRGITSANRIARRHHHRCGSDHADFRLAVRRRIYAADERQGRPAGRGSSMAAVRLAPRDTAWRLRDSDADRRRRHGRGLSGERHAARARSRHQGCHRPPHDGSDVLARFEREAHAIAALSHPNIVALYDVGRDNGAAFAVMELLDGESLDRRLATADLPWRTALAIAAAVADGLHPPTPAASSTAT